MGRLGSVSLMGLGTEYCDIIGGIEWGVQKGRGRAGRGGAGHGGVAGGCSGASYRLAPQESCLLASRAPGCACLLLAAPRPLLFPCPGKYCLQPRGEPRCRAAAHCARTCGSVPERTSSSAMLSRLAESEAVAEQSGRKSGSRPRQMALRSPPWREATQLRLPCSVLISPAQAGGPGGQLSGRAGATWPRCRALACQIEAPAALAARQTLRAGLRLPLHALTTQHPPLCPSTRMGCASGHLGVVLVEKRRW